MPPKPSKKAKIIILIEIFFKAIVEMQAIPLVISIIPSKVEEPISKGIPKASKTKANKFKK